ncbi:MAG: hypothetical protein B0D92_04420, partial [Spirochaeta sp. LUC14_002_19_P3]
AVLVAMVACASPTSTEITATEVPKRAQTDVRDSYVLFRIEATQAVSNYYLGVKQAALDAPSAAELTEGGLKRNLSTTAINVLIAQELNAKMVVFAKMFFGDKTHQTLGTDMHGVFKEDNFQALILDDAAVGEAAWVSQSVLQAGTAYKLYGMLEGGSVNELLEFATDATSTKEDARPTFVDSTLENGHLEISVKTNEFYIFPMQTTRAQIQTGQTAGLQSFDFEKDDDDDTYAITTILVSGKEIYGNPGPELDNHLYLFKSGASDDEVFSNAYILFDTLDVGEDGKTFYNKASDLYDDDLPVVKASYSTLIPQP